MARALVAAETDGQKGHGLSRVAAYAAQARSGKVDGHAVPRLHRARAASMMIDVANGFAYPAFELAIAELPASRARPASPLWDLPARIMRVRSDWWWNASLRQACSR